MVFETKKVRTETLSEYLVEVRQETGLSLEQVSDKTGICLKFLDYLESGSYGKLPPNVYVVGFLKQLAALYAVPKEILLEQFKKERGIATQVAKRLPVSKKNLKSYFSRLVLTPKLMGLAAGAGFIGLTIVYLITQLVQVSTAPNLSINQPSPGQLVKESFVKISGSTDPGTSLMANGQNNIFVDASGNFRTTIPVITGQADLIFTATNKFSKQTVTRVPIIVDLPKTADHADPSVATTKELSLKLDFLQPLTLNLVVDGVALPSQSMAAGSNTVVTGNRLILVSTTDAGRTFVTLNGRKMGKLGHNGEKMANVPFSVETLGSLPHPVAAGKESAISN